VRQAGSPQPGRRHQTFTGFWRQNLRKPSRTSRPGGGGRRPPPSHRTPRASSPAPNPCPARRKDKLAAVAMRPSAASGSNPLRIAPVGGSRARSRPRSPGTVESKIAFKINELAGCEGTPERRRATLVAARPSADGQPPAPRPWAPASPSKGSPRKGPRQGRHPWQGAVALANHTEPGNRDGPQAAPEVEAAQRPHTACEACQRHAQYHRSDPPHAPRVRRDRGGREAPLPRLRGQRPPPLRATGRGQGEPATLPYPRAMTPWCSPGPRITRDT